MYIDTIRNNRLIHRKYIEDFGDRSLFEDWSEWVELHQQFADMITDQYIKDQQSQKQHIAGFEYYKSFKSKIDQLPYDETDDELQNQMQSL